VRSFRKLMLALIATGIASSTRFLVTVAPFSPNYYAWVYVLVTLAFGADVVVSLVGHRKSAPEPSRRTLLFAGKALITPWTAAAVAVPLGVGGLASLYKQNRHFANVVNAARVRFSVTTGDAWTLAPAFPGKLFEQPIDLYLPPGSDQRFYVLTRPGRLLRYTKQPWQKELLLDISKEVRSVEMEFGALSFALHPEFGREGSANQGVVYVWYTHVDGQEQRNRLSRFDVSLPSLEARNASRLLLMDIGRPPSGMHNGGTLRFGKEGFLFLSIGDYLGNAMQTLDRTLCCGIFRIDVDQRGGDVSAPIKKHPEDAITQNYFVPKDNPWFGRANTLEEYWAHGFRNPFRMWVDPLTEEIWLGDVGKDSWEEQNRVKKGDNGQWNYREGPGPGERGKPSKVIGTELEPIHAYRQSSMLRATIGGLVYRGDLHPSLQGLYLFADNNASTLFALAPERPEVEPRILARGNQFGQTGITAITTDRAGDIYLTVLGTKERESGEILKLVRSDGAPPSEPAKPAAGQDGVRAKFEMVCSRCHGSDGRGAKSASVGLTPRPDFTSSEWQQRTSDERIKKVVLEGGAAVGLSTETPGWKGFLTPEEMDPLVEYLRSVENSG